MNAQERYEKFVLPDDAHKVTVVKDEKVENAVARVAAAEEVDSFSVYAVQGLMTVA